MMLVGEGQAIIPILDWVQIQGRASRTGRGWFERNVNRKFLHPLGMHERAQHWWGHSSGTTLASATVSSTGHDEACVLNLLGFDTPYFARTSLPG